MSWGAAIGALAGGASSALGGIIQYQTAKRLMQKQYEYNTKAIRAYYNNNRYSLENAGYNALLGIPGSTAQGFTPSSTGIMADVAGGIQAGAESVNSAQKVANETQATKSQIKVNSAESALKEEQAKTEIARREQMNIDNLRTKAETTLKDKEANWYDKRQAKELDKMASEAEFNRGALEINRYNANTQRMEYYNNRMNAYSNSENARANTMNARTNSAVGASQQWRNYNQSLGYTTDIHLPWGLGSVSHTGNPNGYTNIRNKPTEYRYEYINGHRVPVRYF